MKLPNWLGPRRTTVSNPDLDDLRRDYKFHLSPENRCESCRHARPTSVQISSYNGRCVLLGISIENVRCSVCPGWQTSWLGTVPRGA